jgi:hypothetical protein
MWVTGRPPSEKPGLLVYVMADDINVTSSDQLVEAFTRRHGDP